MPAPGPSAGRRLALALAALACAAAAFLLAATWLSGAHTWPPGEETVERRLGTAPADLAARLARGDMTKPLRIGVVGDIQNGISELGDLLDAFRDEHVDFILQLGDAANVGLPGRYAVLRRVFEEHAPGIPVIAVPGNHDIEPDGTTAVWTQWVGPAEWRADLRGWRFVGLDDAAGTISPDSMKLLEEVAKEPPPRCGTVVVAHRPLAAPAGTPTTDPYDARGRRLAASGVAPTLTLSGHWHRNDTYRDARGATHYLLGENCDRSSAGGDPSVSKAILTLSPPDAAPPVHDLHVEHIARRMSVSGEFLRLAVGSVYPALRGHSVLAWFAAIAGVFAAWRLVRAALRRAPAAT